MSGGDDTVLQVSGVQVALAGRTVLSDVNLRVAAGTVVGLLGPNGAGKTTLLRSILGLLPTSAGKIDVDAGTASIGYVPQRHEFAWDFPVTVEQVVMTGRVTSLGLWRWVKVEDWTAVHDALERVELSDLRRRPVGQLSGGQRQRVLVARALATRPSLLLLDEPFTGLDLPTQDVLSGTISRLAADGCAVVITTHDLLAALASCDELVLLRGTVVASGPPAMLDDASVWTEVFGVGPDSPLLHLVGAR